MTPIVKKLALTLKLLIVQTLTQRFSGTHFVPFLSYYYCTSHSAYDAMSTESNEGALYLFFVTVTG